MKANDVFWPEICDGKAEAGQVPKLYNVNGTPDLFVIDRDGNIAGRVETARLLDPLLAEVAGSDPFPKRTGRDTWQRPVEVMNRLGIKPGSKVADVGAGGGYFSFRIAARVGPKGKVYAQDLDEKALAHIRDRAAQENIAQMETIQGTQDDPKLPDSILDAVLIVDTFHEFTNEDAMMAGIYRALAPGGRLGVLDRSTVRGLDPSEYRQRHLIPQEDLIQRIVQTGLRLVSFDGDFAGPPDGIRSYFVIFEKPH